MSSTHSGELVRYVLVVKSGLRPLSEFVAMVDIEGLSRRETRKEIGAMLPFLGLCLGPSNVFVH
jgi:hypothetical protein